MPDIYLCWYAWKRKEQIQTKKVSKNNLPENIDTNSPKSALAWGAGDSPCGRYYLHKLRKRRGFCRPWKSHPNIKLHELISPTQKIHSSPIIYFNWYNRINFKLILLTLLFKSLFLRQIFYPATFCYLIYFQSLHNGASVDMFYQKRQRQISWKLDLHLQKKNFFFCLLWR